MAPKVKVTVGVSGTGGGFKKFARGETNLSNASRPIKDKEMAACKENNISYLELEVAYDGLAVLVHPENDWVDSFTIEELKKIWEPAAQGKIMKWNQIRPEWPDKELHLFGPGVASGTYDYFTEAILGKSGSSRGDFTASEDDHVLLQGIAGDKYALGFFGLAYYAENKDRLKLIGVHNGEKVVKPTLETVSNGSYSPLSRPLFIYVNSTSIASPEVVEFVKFYIDNASELSKDVGYIPLPAEEVLYTETRVNALDLKIARDCERFLALYNPVATDLRFIMAILKINHELERIADHAFNISKYVVEQETEITPKVLEALDFDKMYHTLDSMLYNITTAYVDKQVKSARKVFKKDKVLDKINARSFQVLEEQIKKDTSIIPQALILFSVVKKLERVGDLIKNIAEEIIFYTEAEVIKHRKKNKRLQKDQNP